MVAFTQKVLSKDSIYKGSAIVQSTSKKRTTVSITPQVLSDVHIEENLIIEMVEYAFNPNDTTLKALGTNAFEVSFFNYSDKAHVELANLSAPLELGYPIFENYQLALFIDEYNELSPFLTQEKLMRDRLMSSASLNCSFYN